MHFSIKGNLVNIQQKKIFAAEVFVSNGKIRRIQPLNFSPSQPLHYILPGFIDAHVHIESSMLVPAEFARLAVVHGTVATVSDPHEIANVCGIDGVEFMIENGRTVPFKFNFGAPSCVPATTFETAGAKLNAEDVDKLLQKKEIRYLSEMMNFPGVLHGDEEVMKKIASAKQYDKPVDGHAPGLRGAAAQQYIKAGISTDHECFTKEEALDKLKHGMKIIIREGSAAKNFEALIDLLNDYPDMIMFCSDDKHPDSLVQDHINQLCARAVAKGIDVFNVLQAACINPVVHYKLDVGLLKEGDAADFILVKDLKAFEVMQTYIDGALVAENGKTLIERKEVARAVNNFHCSLKKPADFAYTRDEAEKISEGHDGLLIPVIEALDGQLITNKVLLRLEEGEDELISNVEDDILKIVVVNRYQDALIAKAFIKNFGLKQGAIASSVAHDSHNIVAVGVDDESICRAVNLVIEQKGGVSVWKPPLTPPTGENNTQPLLNENVSGSFASPKSRVSADDPFPRWGKDGMGAVLALPVAGLMSTDDGYKVAEQYSIIDKAAKDLGSTLSSPFMTLSFMALLVIPHLKLSDKGLFDGDAFRLLTA